MSQLLRFVLVSLLALVSGCQSVSESSVYEWLAAQMLETRHELVVASQVDSRWFHENPIEAVIAAGTAKRGTEQPWLAPEHVPLLRRLFELNAQDGSVQWSPSDQRVRLLHGEFRAKPHGADESERMCFSQKSGAPIAVSTDARGRHSFRPYRSFSRVALSDDGKFAMLKVAYACAPMSGASERIIVLRRLGEAWEVVGGTLLWIS